MSGWAVAGFILGVLIVPLFIYNIGCALFSKLIFRNDKDDVRNWEVILLVLLDCGMFAWANTMGWGGARSVSVAVFFLVLIGATIALAFVSSAVSALLTRRRKRHEHDGVDERNQASL